MIAASGFNDVIRMYNITQRDGIGFNLAYIGSDFTEKLPEPFDQGYMRALFDYGYQRARRGYDWAKQPPLSAVADACLRDFFQTATIDLIIRVTRVR